MTAVPSPAPPGARLATDWVLETASRPLDAEEILSGFGERLVEGGLRLWRISTSLLTLHPEVFVRNVVWTRGQGATATTVAHSITESPSYVGSPVERIHQGSGAFRVRLVEPEERGRFRVLEELAARGATDYFIAPVRFRDGRTTYVAWASDHPEGFRPEELRLLEEALPALGLRLQLESSEFALRSLLRVYLGQNAAARVLAGQVRRGTGQTVSAALWYCDLRGFTELSDRTSPREVVSVLDRYFEAVGGPIEEEGGEILKFIGDAVLAIFPVSGDDASTACRQALAAARKAQVRLGALNAEREGEGKPPLGIGLALHVGEVLYGNIGAHARLDFTVIGAAVNEAARVESLCKPLARQVLLTAPFARALPDARLTSLGLHTLKGVREPQELYGLEEVPPSPAGRGPG